MDTREQLRVPLQYMHVYFQASLYKPFFISVHFSWDRYQGHSPSKAATADCNPQTKQQNQL